MSVDPTQGQTRCPLSIAGLAVLCFGFLICPTLTSAGETPEPALLAIESIEIKPPRPTAETLCELRVRIRNDGDRAASSLDFRVSLGDHDLEVYDRQLIYELLPAGETTELRLFNFWVSDARRPPATKKLRISVNLQSATWMRIEKSSDGVENWMPREPASGLPVSGQLIVAIEN